MKKLPVILLILFLTTLIVSGAAGWFYWFQLRPTEIRKECNQERDKYLKAESVKTQEKLSHTPPLLDPTNAYELEAELNKNADQQGRSVYESCLNSKGLNGT